MLCIRCRDELSAFVGLLPQQLAPSVAAPTEDALVDRWGRVHPLGVTTLIGRTIEANGLVILDRAVSRTHARLARSVDGWRLDDLGSLNGTYVNDAAVSRQSRIHHGDRLSFGGVELYLARGATARSSPAIDPASIETLRFARSESPSPFEVDDDVDTDVELPILEMRIVACGRGSGGYLEIGDTLVQLSLMQLELIALLARRMLDDAAQASRVRGFVRTSELLGSLSWQSCAPDDTHLKQVVRRTRQALARAGVGEIIESRHGFGYRLAVLPVMKPAKE